jgi:hypothetical protein
VNFLTKNIQINDQFFTGCGLGELRTNMIPIATPLYLFAFFTTGCTRGYNACTPLGFV